MSKLAINGGTPAVDEDLEISGDWPIVTDEDKKALHRVIDSGSFWGKDHSETVALEKEYADFTALDRLPKVDLSYDYSFEKAGEFGKVQLRVTNPSEAIAFFVFLDLFGQAAGAISQFPLFSGQSLGRVASLVAPLQALLKPDQPFDLLDVLAESRLFAFQAIRAIFTEQQFEQRLKVRSDLLLTLDRPLELLLAEQVDEQVQLASS